MTVRVTGAWCATCGEKPADRDGLCRDCERTLRAWGHDTDLDRELADLNAERVEDGR
jgi:hypothetical protein